MHWKKFKSLPRSEKTDEVYYIIGLDIGNDSSGIAFFNLAESAPEIIDLSGGYGRPSVPTVMQYIADTKEWVFGEYAILNRGVGSEITLSSLISRLGNFEYIDLDRRPVSVVSVLALFIKELLSSVKSINPKAEIVGIVVAVPGYFGEQAREELQRAFKLAGYEKELIAQVSDRECVFTHYYLNRKPEEERTLLLDYGSREVRGGLYHVVPKGNSVAIKSMSSLFDDTIGTAKINDDVHRLFESFLNSKQLPATLGKQINEHISAFVYQHREMLFQKNIRTKPIKLYFNFAYPPFQQSITHEQAERLILPYSRQFTRFINDVLEKNLYGDEAISPRDVDNVLCVGGGFEMLWARETVENIFKGANIHFYKNTKIITAEGAATVAALALDAIDGVDVAIEDKHQLHADIGLQSERFLPLAERNSFWWQKHPVKYLLVNSPVEGELPLELAERNAEGDIRTLMSLSLSGLPKRPKGATRLSIGLKFYSNEEFTLTVQDQGFGELFPKEADYKRSFDVNLNENYI
jgi:molecular chaperone DnaK (HSP70)